MSDVSKYWVWNNFLSHDNCNSLISEYYKPEEQKVAAIGADAKAVNLEYRKTDVCWIPTSEAISLLLFSKSLVANYKAGWGFDIEDCEPTQIARYEEGGHYDWHTDEAFYHRSRGYHRKVSSILFLSDANEYEGGEFLFDSLGGGQKIDVGVGTIICFPSELRHKVAPVTKGVRYSLASWAVGPLMR